MYEIIDFLFGQYKTYSNSYIIIETLAIIFSICSVLFSLKNKVAVFPTGILSTILFVYLLYQWGLIGDMIVNAYYLYMSIYGWIIWTKKIDDTHVTPISKINKKDYKPILLIFIGAMVFIILLYHLFDKWNDWTAYVDTFTTGLFFVGMFLMAKRKLEHWLILLIADIISIPLYFVKGYSLTSLLYIIYSVIAYFGYLEWKKNLNNSQVNA